MVSNKAVCGSVVQKQARVSRSKPSQSDEAEAQPSQVGGQEVEMVDQGMQVPLQSVFATLMFSVCTSTFGAQMWLNKHSI